MGFLRNIAQNIFPGFVVSLIALPLSLGLALASGAPPIAGVITAVVGGIVVSLLGGSHLTITGPGNGLVVATLTAVTALGSGNPLHGYLFTLAAVVVSGALIFFMGLFRFGNLSDFFPSAAIRGMLAAIGLIIMSKQLHVMLGITEPEARTTMGLFASLPESIGLLFNGQVPAAAWLVGLAALLIMFLYAQIRIKAFHFVPAPMWIVVLAILFTGFSHHLPPGMKLSERFLIDIPDNFLSELSFPNFDKFWTGDFWIAVISLSLITIIESLLSIRGVDKLDPKKRRSNVNKDLRALGLATMVSGALGGLNVVTVIARSSVNVTNGATARSSNFFHGAFLLLFVLLFSSQLQMIPLPALAAILVYTGYKLTEPRVFREIYMVGWEQLVIFLVTMFTTLFTNLVTGIVAGFLLSLVFQLTVLPRVGLFVRYLFRPNTLLYREDDGQYHLSVRAYSNFINFIGLRRKLDSIPQSARVIVDFSLADFVDYSVMEQLQNYYQSFREGGGDLEVIGLEDLGAKTPHDLAPRMPHSEVKSSRAKLSRRQKALRLFARKLNFEFSHQEILDFSEFKKFKFFQKRLIDRGRNKMTGELGRIRMTLADLDYHEGALITRESHHSTMVLLALPASIPSFVMEKELLLDRVAHLAGFRDIDFKMHPDFSRSFKVKGQDRDALHRFFDDELIEFFQSNKAFHLESNGEALLIFEKERLGIIREIKQLVSFASRLATILNRKLDKPC